MTQSWRRRCSLALAATFVLAAVNPACSGGNGPAGDDAAAGRVLDPARAEVLAHSLLLLPGDLPGIGWESVKEDEFDDGQAPAETAACAQVEARRVEIRAQTEPARLARAERELQRGQADALPLSVETTVAVFSRNDAPAEALAGFRRMAASGDFDQCLDDRISRNLGPASPATVDTRRGKAQTAAPGGGVSLAFDFRLRAGGEIADLRYETYVWRFANALVTITVSGPVDEITGSLISAAIGRTQARLDEAAR